MPKYNATGIEASLSIANLQASFSNVVDLRMGSQQKQDADRVEAVFANGRKLPELPVGADGGEKGVMQFVGDNEDLPLFVVEAGDSLRSGTMAKAEEGPEDFLPVKGGPVQGAGTDTDSPLTSLSGTPSDGTPAARDPTRRTALTPVKGRAHVKKTQKGEPTPALTSFASFERARGFLDAPNGLQALCLTVQTCHKSFLLKAGETKRAKDLKLEVFLNGQIVGTTLLNTRGSATELKFDKIVYHGTRVHRQSERGWTYNAAAAAEGEGPSAVQRWQATASALNEEAKVRGHNKYGECPPSAELLNALSRLQPPERLREKHGLAVFDLVVTAGTGKKYGPETAYITEPTRMDNPGYKVAALEDPFADAEMLFGTTVRDPSPTPLPTTHLPYPPPFGLTQSSPEVPLMRQRRSMTTEPVPAPETPSKKQRLREKMPEFEIDGLNLDKIVDSYENTRGKIGQKRTLRQRLNDIAQMNPANRAKAIPALKEELDEETLGVISRAAKKRMEQELMPSPSKKARHDTPVPSEMMGFEGALMMLADAALAAEDGTLTMDPMMIHHQPVFHHYSPPSVPNPPGFRTYDDPDLMLMHDVHASIVRDTGTSENDSAPAPQTTPQRRTRASALAGSPCSVPVKIDPRSTRVRTTPTSQQKGSSDSVHRPSIGSPIPINPILHPRSGSNNNSSPGVSPPKSGRGANRTRNQWIPGEKTAQQALVDFDTGTLEASKGSVVGYAPLAIEGKEVQRQIGKARGGEFAEESVVVGMRWIVV